VSDTDFLCRLVVAQLKRSDRFMAGGIEEAAMAAEEE
jgi:hypothetical protein